MKDCDIEAVAPDRLIIRGPSREAVQSAIFEVMDRAELGMMVEALHPARDGAGWFSVARMRDLRAEAQTALAQQTGAGR